jgi:hypothetical protein
MPHKAKLKTFPATGTPSLLEGKGPDAFNLGDKAQTDDLNEKRKAAYEKVKASNPNYPVSVVYDNGPGIFPGKDDTEKQAKVEKTLHLKGHKENAGDGRNNTKHRTVGSLVNCWYPDPNAPHFQLYLTTVCGPNFMGTSPKDEKEFLTDGEMIKIGGKEVRGKKFKSSEAEAKFKNTLRLLYRRALSDQILMGERDTLVIPPVDMGAFLKKLDGPSKALAYKLNAEALREAVDQEMAACKKAKLTVKEVFLAHPDNNKANKDKRSRTYQAVEEAFQGYAGEVPVTLTNANVFAVVDALRKKSQDLQIHGREGLNIGLVNPGDDNAMGGNFRNGVVDKSKRLAPTLEEQIFHFTDASKVQCLENNAKNFNFYQFGAPLSAVQNPCIMRDPTKHVVNFSKSTVTLIQDCVDANKGTMKTISSNEYEVTHRDISYTVTPNRIEASDTPDNYDLMVDLAVSGNINQPHLVLYHPDPAELKKMQQACEKRAIPYKVSTTFDDYKRLVDEAIVEAHVRPGRS